MVNYCASLLSSGEMKVKVHLKIHVWIQVNYDCVLNHVSNHFIFFTFYSHTYLIRMSCISKMSPRPVFDVPGLSHQYLLTKTVGHDDDTDTLTVHINI